MGISEQMRKALDERSGMEPDNKLAALRAFYEAMQRRGVVVRKDYSVPQIDTVGRGIYKGSGRVQSATLLLHSESRKP